MIFYLALDENGHRQLRGTQADARAVNKQFEQIDIPTDKAGLMAFVQALYDQVDSTERVADDVHEELWKAEPTPEPTVTPAKLDQLTRQQIEERWTSFPLSWRLDMHHVDLEEARLLAPRSLDMRPVVGEPAPD